MKLMPIELGIIIPVYINEIIMGFRTQANERAKSSGLSLFFLFFSLAFLMNYFLAESAKKMQTNMGAKKAGFFQVKYET